MFINNIQNPHHPWLSHGFTVLFFPQEQIVADEGLRRLQRGGGGHLGGAQVEGMVPAPRIFSMGIFRWGFNQIPKQKERNMGRGFWDMIFGYSMI